MCLAEEEPKSQVLKQSSGGVLTTYGKPLAWIDDAMATMRTNGVSKAALPAELSERELKIVKLNARVDKITREAVEEAEKNGTQLKPHFVFAQRKKTAILAGTPIYVRRYAATVYSYTLLAAGMIAYGVTQVHPLIAVLSIITMYLEYDMHSGILHVVFDRPENIDVPVLGQVCLEFQWHHSIPDDLVRKDFVDTCGDLNVVAAIIIAFNLIVLDFSKGGFVFIMFGMKILMGYFGQYSHRSGHAVGSGLSPLARALQKNGLMMSTKEHWAHHQEPHEYNFCHIGYCNPVIHLLRRITLNNLAWIMLFLVWTAFAVKGPVLFMEKLASSLSL